MAFHTDSLATGVLEEKNYSVFANERPTRTLPINYLANPECRTQSGNIWRSDKELTHLPANRMLTAR